MFQKIQIKLQIHPKYTLVSNNQVDFYLKLISSITKTKIKKVT